MIPLAVMECPRRVSGGRHRQVIEPDVFAPAVVDLERDEGGAKPIGRVGHRFARTTVIAVAIFDPLAFDLPVPACHFRLPPWLPVGLSRHSCKRTMPPHATSVNCFTLSEKKFSEQLGFSMLWCVPYRVSLAPQKRQSSAVKLAPQAGLILYRVLRQD